MGKELTKESLQDGAILSDRNCTDICMILFAALFVAGWVVVASVAISRGRPSRILLPENFRGDLCGDTGGPLEDVIDLYIPRPSRLSYGLCAPSCPSPGDYVCNNDFEKMLSNSSLTVRNDYYNHNSEEFSLGAAVFFRCLRTKCNTTDQAISDRYYGLLQKTQEYKCFFVFYNTGATLHRCLPFQSDRDNQTLAALFGESKSTIAGVADSVGVGQFFIRGFGEVEQGWVVILICGLTAVALSLIWIILLRCILAPLIYFCILLIFALFIVIGYFAKTMADDLENVRLPGDTATENQVTIWRAVQWGCWIAAGIYFVAMVWLLKRIKIAIAIMKEGSKAFINNVSLVVIPPIVLVLVAGFVVLFIYLALYIQTIGSVTTNDLQVSAQDTYGSAAVNASIKAAKAANNTLVHFNVSSGNTTVNTTTWTTDDIIKGLHAYNFFGFLWATNFCIMWGFWLMAMATATWYFSATTQDLDMQENGVEGGREKSAPRGTMCRAFLASIRYHMGTILWGSLLIAIIQFIRVLFLYLEEEFLNHWKDSATVKILIYCINCCLAYIERVIKIISKNAFIVNCISSQNFCTCAGEAMGLIVSNAARVGTLSLMSSVACFVLKLFIVGCNCVIAWILINIEALTDGRPMESGLFPLIFIFFLSFIIASLFVNVYESCTDTVMMCFLYDEQYLDKTFLPISLAKLLDTFGRAEEARKEYEKKVREGTDGNPEPKATQKEETATKAASS